MKLKLCEDAYFFKNPEYMEKELEEIISGQMNFIEIDEAEQRLEKVIKQDENRISGILSKPVRKSD